ncbi:MAG: energy-coupled thiamine transporter ThiT [Candidatus Epulonipiscioides saccharophilum]|nr:MAG: energy-coupled thiamine transporter ThiT [Epulopiscium sp. AS2M-Bin001]
MLDVVGGIIFVIFIIFYVITIRKEKWSTKKITIIALCAALGYVLSMITFIRLPQDGGVSLAPMMPIILVAYIYGLGAGMTTGLVYAFLKIFNFMYILTPVQFLLEYFMSPMIVAIACKFGKNSKIQILLGSALALTVRFSIHFIVGATYFKEYAGTENPWIYSFFYNGPVALIEGIITCVILVVLPIPLIIKHLKVKS